MQNSKDLVAASSSHSKMQVGLTVFAFSQLVMGGTQLFMNYGPTVVKTLVCHLFLANAGAFLVLAFREATIGKLIADYEAQQRETRGAEKASEVSGTENSKSI